MAAAARAPGDRLRSAFGELSDQGLLVGARTLTTFSVEKGSLALRLERGPRCRDDVGAGVRVAVDAPTALWRFGDQHPPPIGQLRSPPSVAADPRHFFSPPQFF